MNGSSASGVIGPLFEVDKGTITTDEKNERIACEAKESHTAAGWI